MLGVLHRIDDYLFHLLYARGAPGMTVVAVFFSAIGEGWSLLAVIPLAASRRTRRLAAWLFCTLGGTGVLVFALKAVIRRGRPFTYYDALAKALLDSPTDYSFPSGHAAGSFCFALFVTRALLDRRPRPPFARTLSGGVITLASCIAVSRVVLGFHFPLDVLGGALLGATIGAVAGGRFAASARAIEARGDLPRL